MTQREKLVRAKKSLIELAEYLKNVSEACQVMEVSGRISMISRRLTQTVARQPFMKSHGESPTLRIG
jgi:hypothetical protein